MVATLSLSQRLILHLFFQRGCKFFDPLVSRPFPMPLLLFDLIELWPPSKASSTLPMSLRVGPAAVLIYCGHSDLLFKREFSFFSFFFFFFNKKKFFLFFRKKLKTPHPHSYRIKSETSQGIRLTVPFA